MGGYLRELEAAVGTPLIEAAGTGRRDGTRLTRAGHTADDAQIGDGIGLHGRIVDFS